MDPEDWTGREALPAGGYRPREGQASMSTTRKRCSAAFKAKVAVEAIRGVKTTTEPASELQVHAIWTTRACRKRPCGQAGENPLPANCPQLAHTHAPVAHTAPRNPRREPHTPAARQQQISWCKRSCSASIQRPVSTLVRGLGDCRKQTYRMARDSRSPLRSGSGRVVELCARCRDAEGGRKGKDKPGGMFVDRNRLMSTLPLSSRWNPPHVDAEIECRPGEGSACAAPISSALGLRMPGTGAAAWAVLAASHGATR